LRKKFHFQDSFLGLSGSPPFVAALDSVALDESGFVEAFIPLDEGAAGLLAADSGAGSLANVPTGIGSGGGPE